MKKTTFLFAIISILSLTAFSQPWEIAILRDSSELFADNMKIGIWKDKKGKTLVSLEDESQNMLVKIYSAQNVLIAVTQYDSLGYMNGNYFDFDTLTGNKSIACFEHGLIMSQVGITRLNDTVSYTKQLNDTMWQSMILDTQFKQLWHHTATDIKNGSYVRTSVKTNRIVREGNYKAVSEDMITEKKKYRALLEKYDLVYSFKNAKPETEIPVGTWKFYDENGKLTKEINYDWEGVIQGIK